MCKYSHLLNQYSQLITRGCLVCRMISELFNTVGETTVLNLKHSDTETNLRY